VNRRSCLACGAKLDELRRRDARYCDDQCRQRGARARRGVAPREFWEWRHDHSHRKYLGVEA